MRPTLGSTTTTVMLVLQQQQGAAVRRRGENVQRRRLCRHGSWTLVHGHAVLVPGKQNCQVHGLVQHKPNCVCKWRSLAAAPQATADDPIPPWRQVVAVTAGALLLCNLHRSAFAVLLPDLCSQLGLRASQVGAVQAAMLAAYLAGQVPSGRLADKYSGTRVLLWGLALWSSATALTAAAGLGVGSSSSSAAAWALAVILCSRLVMGLASACVMPCVTATAVKWVPAAERAAMISFVYANFNIGGVIGLTMVPLLAEAFGGSAAFLLSGAAGVAWALTGAVIMQRLHATVKQTRLKTAGAAPTGAEAATSASKPFQNAGQDVTVCDPQQMQEQTGQNWRQQDGQQQQQQQEEEREGSQQQQQQQQQHQPPLLQLIRRLDSGSIKQVALLCYAHAVIGYGFFLVQNWMPLYVASLGSQGLAVTGRLSSMPWLAAAVVGMMAGSAADGLIKNGLPTLFVRQVMQAASFLGCGLSVIPLALSPNPGLVPAVLCLTANLTFYSLSYGGFHAYLQDVCGPYAGVLQGVTNSASILMGMCGSVLTGVVVDASGSYSALFWLLFVMYSTAAVVWCLFTSSHSLQSTRRSVSF